MNHNNVSFKEFVNLFTKEINSLIFVENGKKYKLTSYGNTAMYLLSKYHNKMYPHLLCKKYNRGSNLQLHYAHTGYRYNGAIAKYNGEYYEDDKEYQDGTQINRDMADRITELAKSHIKNRKYKR